jgi:hypothetical protein
MKTQEELLLEKINEAIESGLLNKDKANELNENLESLSVLFQSDKLSTDLDETKLQEMWKKYTEMYSIFCKNLGDVKYNLSLSAKEYKLTRDIILKKNRYSYSQRNDARWLKENFFNTNTQHGDYDVAVITTVKLAECLAIYTFEGVDEVEYDNYDSVIYKVSMINLIHKNFVDRADKLITEIQDWIATLDLNNEKEKLEEHEDIQLKLEI